MEASQTRDYNVAKSATFRAARPDPLRQAQGRLSRRKERLLRMTAENAAFLVHRKSYSPKGILNSLMSGLNRVF